MQLLKVIFTWYWLDSKNKRGIRRRLLLGMVTRRCFVIASVPFGVRSAGLGLGNLEFKLSLAVLSHVTNSEQKMVYFNV